MRLFKIAAAALALACSAGVASAQTKLGYVPTEEHPVGQAVNRFVELVKQKSGGRIAITPYSDGKLGNEPQMQSSIQGGFLEIMVGPTSNLVGAIKEFGLFDLPFFFANFKEVDAVTDGPVGAALFERLKGLNIVGLAYWDNGFRHTTNNRRPIEKVEDFSGLKIRVIPNPLFIDTFATLGTNPVPLPYPELFNALENRTVDAQETPVGLIYASKFYEVQKFLSLTGHVYTPFVLLASKKWFDALPAADKALVMEAAQETAAFQRKLSRDAADNIANVLLVKAGMKVNTPTPEERARMREKVQPVVEKYTKILGEDLVKQAREAMANAK